MTRGRFTHSKSPVHQTEVLRHGWTGDTLRFIITETPEGEGLTVTTLRRAVHGDLIEDDSESILSVFTSPRRTVADQP